MVLEVQVHLVQKHPSEFASLPVFHHPLVYGLQSYHQGRGPQLLTHFVQVQADDAAGHIHIRVVSKHVEAALGYQLRRQGQLSGLRLRLLQYLSAPVGEQRRRGFAAEIGPEHFCRAAVYDGLVAALHHTGAHLLLQYTGYQLRLQGYGVFILVALCHFQWIYVVDTIGGYLYDLTAESSGQSAVLPLGVQYHDVVLSAQSHVLNGALHAHGLA